ncbi:hypothetical protein H0I54_16545 [Yersinia kristensenii]|uniref:hypothetical protein n=1 Tax=Yersinia kristensenii TaxID=28152 RepID=UPI001C60A215|nr:hypothetical protein [Yersinia kristensenii]MBW5843418.1 hypothetical protein [Yersinia kristensenii]
MALVKVLVANLFAGANFQKLEVGQSYEVDDAIADKWIAGGKAEKSTEKKGEKLVFEVATPSVPVSNVKELQTQLDEAQGRINELTTAAEAAEAAHAEAIAEVTKRAEAAEAALTAVTKKDK